MTRHVQVVLWSVVAVSLVSVGLVLTGCGVTSSASAAGPSDAAAPIAGTKPGTVSRNTTINLNDLTASAQLASVAPGDDLNRQGTLQSTSQVDLYDLGPIYEGEKLFVWVNGYDGLDPAAAVFDENNDVWVVNDDRSYYGGDYNAYIEAVAMHTAKQCYVAVACSPRATTTGDYQLSVQVTEAETLAEPEPEQIYLNFDGASQVRIGTRPPVDVPVFDATMIDNRYAGQTETIINLVTEYVEQDYFGLNVDIYCSLYEDPPEGYYTTVHFGAYDPALLGVAENIDEYNQWHEQQCLVFVDTFSVFSSLSPTVEEIAQALANVASHESGHLLGLYHTQDPTSIMDISASLRQMLYDQHFVQAPLNPDTFPSGNQHALQILYENVGGEWSVIQTVADQWLNSRAMRRMDVADDGPPARSMYTFGMCD